MCRAENRFGASEVRVNLTLGLTENDVRPAVNVHSSLPVSARDNTSVEYLPGESVELRCVAVGSSSGLAGSSIRQLNWTFSPSAALLRDLTRRFRRQLARQRQVALVSHELRSSESVDALPGPYFDNVRIVRHSSGTATLSISQLRASNAGRYTCTAQNNEHLSDSRAVDLVMRPNGAATALCTRTRTCASDSLMQSMA